MSSSYDAWRTLEYAPAIRSCSPAVLLKVLTHSSRVLEVGCGSGEITLTLAAAGHDVTAIDVNEQSVRHLARTAAAVRTPIKAFVGDALTTLPLRQPFDVVVAVRVLTCFADLAEWRTLIALLAESVKSPGLLYVHDFAYDPLRPAYGARYSNGVAKGWRLGNFAVGDRFIAHHHTADEIAQLTSPFDSAWLTKYDSLSMNGNACTMFELLAWKS